MADLGVILFVVFMFVVSSGITHGLDRLMEK